MSIYRISYRPQIQEILGHITTKYVAVVKRFPQIWSAVCNEISEEYPTLIISDSEKLYLYLNPSEKPTCSFSGARRRFKGFTKGLICPRECGCVSASRRKSSMDKYGVPHPMQNKQCQEKRERTTLQRYGVKNVFQVESVQKKSRTTCNRKYGVDHALQNASIHRKMQDNNLKKSGYSCAFASPPPWGRRPINSNYSSKIRPVNYSAT